MSQRDDYIDQLDQIQKDRERMKNRKTNCVSDLAHHPMYSKDQQKDFRHTQNANKSIQTDTDKLTSMNKDSTSNIII